MQTTDYYPAIKRNEVLTDTLYDKVNLKDIVLNERSQMQKTRAYESIYMKYPEEANHRDSSLMVARV